MALFRRGEIGRVAVALLSLPALALGVAAFDTAGDGPGEGVGRAGPDAGGDPGWGGGDALPEPRRPEAFLAAYERSRRATWLVEFDFRRRLRHGGRLDLDVVELNRPPDHLVAGLGGLSGTVDGRTVRCDLVEGRQVCAPRGEAVPFEERLAAQLSELGDAIAPPAEWYAVAPGEPRTVAGERAGCFLLRRIVDVPAPPYGEEAEYCFTADGVPVLTRVRRVEGSDERVAVAVRRNVTDADVAALLAP